MRKYLLLILIGIFTKGTAQNSRINICDVKYDILDYQEILNQIIENEIAGFPNYDTIYFNTEFLYYKVDEYLIENSKCYYKPLIDIDLEKVRLSCKEVEILKHKRSDHSLENRRKPIFSVSFPIINSLNGDLVIMFQKSFFSGARSEIKYVFKKENGQKNKLLSRKQIMLSSDIHPGIDENRLIDLKPDKEAHDEMMKKLDKGIKTLPERK